ncbi:Protein MAIN-LIKE 2, partial [Camellia lanceoleosa]
MADDIPSGGAPPEMDVDPEAELLSLHIRPFDSAAYRPAIHMLPPDGLRQFRSFHRAVPSQLLLREPESHLSYDASEGDSYAFQGYGNVAARGWYIELPDAIRHIVDQAGFGTFCRGLSRLTASSPLLATLVERWWDTTDSFHFSATGDMTMTPFDFSMLIGIGIGGDPIPFDTDMDEWEVAQMYLLGELPPLARPGFVRYSWFEDHFRIQPALAEEAPMAQEEAERYARGFLMFLLGMTLFADRANTVPLSDSCSEATGRLERPRESFIFFRRYFDAITTAEPWAPLPAAVRERYVGAEETARFRILLEGPVCRAWYLGERFLRQTLGLLEQIALGPPPTHMRHTEMYTIEDMADYTISWDAEGFRGEGDYAEYVRTYIMRPLSSGGQARRERPVAPAARVGAGAGEARIAQARGKSGSQRERGAGWPALPTMMTCRGQGGETYQIPFAPLPADHELVGFYDLPPYTRQSLELTASVMGMLQWSLDLLAIYGIPIENRNKNRVRAVARSPPRALLHRPSGFSTLQALFFFSFQFFFFLLLLLFLHFFFFF